MPSVVQLLSYECGLCQPPSPVMERDPHPLWSCALCVALQEPGCNSNVQRLPLGFGRMSKFFPLPPSFLGLQHSPSACSLLPSTLHPPHHPPQLLPPPLQPALYPHLSPGLHPLPLHPAPSIPHPNCSLLPSTLYLPQSSTPAAASSSPAYSPLTSLPQLLLSHQPIPPHPDCSFLPSSLQPSLQPAGSSPSEDDCSAL